MQGLGLAAKENESVTAQFGQMLRQGGLAEPKGLDQGPDGHLTARREEAQNDEPSQPLFARRNFRRWVALDVPVDNR